MAEILKEWLTERLHRPINWETDNFGETMRDGVMVAEILLNYHVINDEKMFLIRPTSDLQEIRNNWKYLSVWLMDLDVKLSDVDLTLITGGKSSVILRLFYQLFLHLDKRDRINFIKKERKMVSSLVEKIDNRFKVTKVKEKEPVAVDDLSKPLLNKKHYIEWQRKKEEDVKKTYDYVRHKYLKMFKKAQESETATTPCYSAPKPRPMTSKEKQDIQKFTLKHPCYKNYTYKELMELEENANEGEKSIGDSDWVKNYMDNLHSKIDKKGDSEEFHNRLQSGMVNSVWDMSVAEEEVKFDTELAKKVMKLSQFEKEMCTQLMETKQQARNLIDNRIQADNEFADQRGHQFSLYLDNIKQQINVELAELDFEKNRQDILHKRLYAEKMKRKRQHYYEICYETMVSLLDLATKIGYFKKLMEGDVPDHFLHEWKTLFFKMQPVFEVLDPIEGVLRETSIEEEQSPEEEEIIRLELERQDALNDTEFLENHKYIGPWTLQFLIPNFDPTAEERNIEYLGSRILGHVVYTLLEVKYPFPPERQPAALPMFPSKALLRGLPDRSITAAMQILLNFKKIHVTRPETAINFCLKSFKNEMVGCTDIELSYDKFTAAAQSEDSKELIRLMKSEEDILIKNNPNPPPAPSVLPANQKQTQTPKTIPEEEIKLSPPAELGRYAYEALSFGDSLTDYLMASMFVEYLKDQIDINGFVIINYPNTYREAQILEEVFSGKAPPDEQELLEDSDDIYLEDSISKHRKREKDAFKTVRVSKLFDNPHKKAIEKPFESYFTSYIRLKETLDILQEEMIWDLNVENSELIDRFYAVLGMNYSMYYEIIDRDVLTLICKYIIGDPIICKSYDDLFGFGVLSDLDFLNPLDKRQKSKIIKPEASLSKKSVSKMRRSAKSLKSLNSVVSDIRRTSAENKSHLTTQSIVLLEPTEEESKSVHSVGLVEEKLLAGDVDWDYGELPIPEGIGVALATCWETVEQTYISDLQQLFLAKRIQMNSLIPYTRFLRDKMEQIITLPSKKQDLVVAFQREYNDFENDWRNYNLTKNEWHCRINELRFTLYKICDERKLFAEQQRQFLIAENWAVEELTSMANTYISCMQTELNRYILSIQALHDFYFTLIKHLPPTDRLSSKDLTKIPREYEGTSSTSKKTDDKLFRQLKAAYIDLQMKDVQIDYSNNPFNMTIESNVKFALKVIKDTNDSYRNLINRESSEVAKIQIPVKKKDEVLESDTSMSPEEIFKANAMKCVEEWIMGVNGEMHRASLRMLALQYKCYTDMRLFNDQVFNTFRDIQIAIDTYYTNEIMAVDRLCKYLQMAVEEGRMIAESLVLEHDSFTIDPNLIQFEHPPTLDESLKCDDKLAPCEFRICHLARLRDLLKICAPSGIVLHKSLIYSMQDFLLYSKECCEGPVMPEGWRNMEPEKVPQIVHAIYGENVYLDWRDFLIYCSNVRFPNIDELLTLRKKFRCKDTASTELIHRDNYLDVILWFEDCFDPDEKCAQLRKHCLYHFFFELFEVSEDMMNYSAFLLAFCKSNDPIEGFANALSMAVGKKTCFRFEDCSDVICKMIEEKKYKDACLECAYKCATKFMDTLVTKVVDYCAGTTIEEVLYVGPPDSKKGKKGQKADNKLKTPDSFSSAREPIKKKNEVKGNVSQSEVNVKITTYICPPCEKKEEEVEKVEEEQESVKISIQPDPEIAYTVSQDVIWKVLQICLPWHFPRDADSTYKNDIAEVLKRLESDTESGDIFVAKFVEDEVVCKLLHKVKKFNVVNIIDEANSVLS